MTEEATSSAPCSTTSTNLLKLTHSQARTFLLKGESYCNFPLPKYFSFDKLIADISTTLENKEPSNFCGQICKLAPNGSKKFHPDGTEKTKPDSPSNYEDVNYKLLNNKDGKYSWRPFQLIHPALYVSLVHLLTEENNWKFITNRFLKFSENEQIRCVSLPVQSTTEESDKAEMITHWWNDVEQSSIELALDYEYLFQTDITGCYESVYTHTVPWALYGKDVSKAKKLEKGLLGNRIDRHLQGMSHGQTNGIPQGSVLMDFIAEMVLGYSDLLLSRKIQILHGRYVIVRYRDDYRIFVNNPQDGERILKALSEVLFDLGMKLNPQKTTSSSNVVRDSIKQDKRYWLNNKRTAKTLHKHLLIIHSLSEKFPNSGSLIIALNDFMSRIRKTQKTRENLPALISILTDIALKNPNTYAVSSAILSKAISLLSDDSEKLKIIGRIRARFDKIPNTGHLELWLQRITLKLDGEIQYDEALCKIASGEEAAVWNSDWLDVELKHLIDPKKVFSEEVLQEMTPIIDQSEFSLFLLHSL